MCTSLTPVLLLSMSHLSTSGSTNMYDTPLSGVRTSRDWPVPVPMSQITFLFPHRAIDSLIRLDLRESHHIRALLLLVSSSLTTELEDANTLLTALVLFGVTLSALWNNGRDIIFLASVQNLNLTSTTHPGSRPGGRGGLSMTTSPSDVTRVPSCLSSNSMDLSCFIFLAVVAFA